MISRRRLLTAMLAGGLLLAGCGRREPDGAPLAADPLIHRFGLTETLPEFRRLYAAGPPAEVLLYALAPERMFGWTAKKQDQALAFLGAQARDWPHLGGINGRGTTVSFETLLAAEVDLVVDAGAVDDTYLSTARRTAEQLGVPYVLVEGRLAQAEQQFRQLGDILRAPDSGRLADLAAAALDFARQHAVRQGSVQVYFARGTDGLETGRKHAIHTEVLGLLGAENVADALGEGGLAKVSLEQVLAWQPEWIFTQDAGFAAEVAQHPGWQAVDAVRQGRVRLFPRLPFGWLDGPPGVNRLPGIYYLAAVLQGRPPTDYADPILALMQALYHHRPDAAQLQVLGLA